MRRTFWRVSPVRRCVCRDVMVKCSEPIVVAHSGLAAKQYVGTRGHPATLTDKTALVLGRWVCRGELEPGGQGELGSCGGLGRGICDRGTLWCNVTTHKPTKSRPARIIRGRHGRLCRDRPLQSSVWHSDGHPFSNERPVLMSPSSPCAQWPARGKNGRALGQRVQCTPECSPCCDWPLSSNQRLDGDEARQGS